MGKKGTTLPIDSWPVKLQPEYFHYNWIKSQTYNVFMTLWGRILDQLRTQKGISQGDLARRMVIGKDEYYRLCRSKRGPTVLTLDALLKGMGCTWKDWALAYEIVSSDDPPSPPRKTADFIPKSPQNRPSKARKQTKRG